MKHSVLSVRLLFWFFALFGFTSLCIFWLNASGVNPDTDFSPAIICIAYAPSLAAIITAALLDKHRLRTMLRQSCMVRVGMQWYGLVLVGPLVLVATAQILSMVFGGPQPASWLTFSALGTSIGPLIAGSLGEELGWRGFAQPLLQKRYSIFWASIIIGLLWATWHLWPVLSASANPSIVDCIMSYIRLVSSAVIYGWLYNATRGSLFIVMLAHAGHNIAVDILPLSNEAGTYMSLLYLAAAAVVTWAARSWLFTRPNQTSQTL